MNFSYYDNMAMKPRLRTHRCVHQKEHEAERCREQVGVAPNKRRAPVWTAPFNHEMYGRPMGHVSDSFDRVYGRCHAQSREPLHSSPSSKCLHARLIRKQHYRRRRRCWCARPQQCGARWVAPSTRHEALCVSCTSGADGQLMNSFLRLFLAQKSQLHVLDTAGNPPPPPPPSAASSFAPTRLLSRCGPDLLCPCHPMYFPNYVHKTLDAACHYLCTFLALFQHVNKPF